MKKYPFEEIAAALLKRRLDGYEFLQQFECAHCGVKQTMEVPNKLFTHGKCEECGKETHIERDGCNYMLIAGDGKVPDFLMELMTKRR